MTGMLLAEFSDHVASSTPRDARATRTTGCSMRLRRFRSRGCASCWNHRRSHIRGRNVHRRDRHGGAGLRHSNITPPSSTILTTAAAGRSTRGRPSCWCRSRPAILVAAMADLLLFCSRPGCRACTILCSRSKVSSAPARTGSCSRWRRPRRTTTGGGLSIGSAAPGPLPSARSGDDANPRRLPRALRLLSSRSGCDLSMTRAAQAQDLCADDAVAGRHLGAAAARPCRGAR